jgi:hypothetical protein
MAREAKVIASIELDRSSVAGTVAGAQQAEAALQGVSAELSGVGAGASGSLRMTQAEFDALGLTIQGVDDRVQAVTEDLEGMGRAGQRAARDVGDAGQQASQRTTRPRGGGAADTVDRFGTSGTQIASALGGGDVANAVGLIGDLGDTIGKLGVAGGISAVAIGLTTLALADYNAQQERSRAALTGALTGLRNYFNALTTLTTDQARARRVELLNQRTAAEQFNAAIQARIEGTFDQASSAFGDLGARVLSAVGQLPITQLQAAAEGATNELNAINAELGGLDGALASNAFEVNDLVAAYDQLTAAQRSQAENEIAVLLEARTLTSEEIEQRRQQLQEERNILEQYAATAENAEALAAATERIAAIDAEYTTLISEQVHVAGLRNDVIQENIAAEAAMAAQLEGVTQALETAASAAESARNSAQQRAVDAAERLGEATREVADAQADSTKAAESLAEAQTKSAQTIHDLESDAADSRVDIAEGLQEDLRRIEENAAASLGNARSNRDALGFVQAKRQRDLERAQRERAGQQQLNDLDKQTRKRLELERRRASEEYNERQRAAVLAHNQLIQATNIERQIRSSGFSAALIDTQNFVNAFRAAFQTTTPTTGGGLQGGKNTGITMNIQGATTQTIKATSYTQAMNVFSQVLTDQGAGGP